MPALGARDQRHADLLRDLEAHRGDAGARQQHRDAHQRDLDHHLRGQPPGGVEQARAAVDILEPHVPGDRVDRVVAADILDEQLDSAGRAAQRAAVYRAGVFVDFVVFVQVLQQRVDRRLLQRRRLEPDLIDILHQVAEHGALAAAGGHGLAPEFLVEFGHALARLDRDRFGFPVDLDRLDRLDVVDQALVAQPAQNQQLGMVAERHQGNDFALVEVDRQRALDRDGAFDFLTVFVARDHVRGGLEARVGQFGESPARHGRHLSLRSGSCAAAGFPGSSD